LAAGEPEVGVTVKVADLSPVEDGRKAMPRLHVPPAERTVVEQVSLVRTNSEFDRSMVKGP